MHSRGALGVQKDTSVRDMLGRASSQVNPQSAPPFPFSVQIRSPSHLANFFTHFLFGNASNGKTSRLCGSMRLINTHLRLGTVLLRLTWDLGCASVALGTRL